VVGEEADAGQRRQHGTAEWDGGRGCSEAAFIASADTAPKR